MLPYLFIFLRDFLTSADFPEQNYILFWPAWFTIKWMVKANWFGSMQCEIFLQTKFIIFPRCTTNPDVSLTWPARSM